MLTDDGFLNEPFLDVQERLVNVGGGYKPPVPPYDERGLLGIQFHPEFPEDRRFFLTLQRPPTGRHACSVRPHRTDRGVRG